MKQDKKLDVAVKTSGWGYLSFVQPSFKKDDDKFAEMLDAMIERARQAIRNIN